MKKMITLLFVCAVPFLMGNDGGCEGTPSSDRKQNAANERLASEAVAQVGIPAIVNFQEKRMLKMLYELRDTEISTVTYIVDLNGNLHKLCDSVGYGLPYGTQFSNPQKPMFNHYETATIPQSEPNGLFMPESADATWVMCVGPDKKVRPVYVEPRAIISPFALATE